MPYQRPTLTALQAQAQQDLAAAQVTGPGGSPIDPSLPGVALAIAWSNAGFAWGFYGYLDAIYQQAVPWTATDAALEAWASIRSVFRKGPAAAAGTASGTGTPGATVPAGAILNRADGQQFAAMAAAAVASTGVVSLAIQAVTAGAAADGAAGGLLTLASPVAGVNVAFTAGALTGGADTETDAALRTRMLAAYASPPQGGAAADYVNWALSVPGVTRAWVTPNGMGPGTVIVYPMLDVANMAQAGFPQGTSGVASNEARDVAATGDLLTVANALFPLRPVSALVYAVAPVAQPVAVTVANLGTLATPATQQAISAALIDMFARLGSVGASVRPTDLSAWPPIDPSDIYAAVASVLGGGRFTVTAPTAPITPAAGSILTLGTLTCSS